MGLIVLLLYVQQVAIVTQIRNFIDTHQVVCAGPFVYAYVEEVRYISTVQCSTVTQPA